MVRIIRPASVALLGLILMSLAILPGQMASGAAQCPSILEVEGSTTVGPIAAGMESGFETAWTGTDVQVTQNGSGNGITAIKAGTTDVGMSSRPLTPTEANGLYVYVIAKDGLIFVINDSMPVTDLTISQIKGIYEGTTTNWSSLGGPNQTIVPRARITASGSQPDMLRLTGTSSSLEAATIAATGLPRLVTSLEMSEAVRDNPNQIAYTSLANLSIPPELGVAGVHPAKVNGDPSNATSTADSEDVKWRDSVINNTYDMPRILHMMTQDKTARPRISGAGVDDTPVVHADDFINRVYTAAGQALIHNEGFVDVPPAAVQPIPDWDINMDGSINIGDLGAITAKWGASSSCGGWIRADGNNNATVSLGDIGTVTGKWGHAGFVPPTYP